MRSDPLPTVPPSILILAVFSTVAFAGAAAGIWFSGISELSRRAIVLGGAVLVAVALFGVLPELAEPFGWSAGVASMFAGLAVVAVIDRFVYPVCPACSPSHDHDACVTRLHGFAWPLITAAILHSLFDGWAVTASYAGAAGSALSIGVATHKLPEGLALGVMLRAALPQRGQALAWAAITQAATLAGGALYHGAAGLLGTHAISVLLALAGGMFLYLGVHAIHGEWRRRRIAEREAQVS
jgi:zinc transporter ZupT